MANQLLNNLNTAGYLGYLLDQLLGLDIGHAMDTGDTITILMTKRVNKSATNII